MENTENTTARCRCGHLPENHALLSGQRDYCRWWNKAADARCRCGRYRPNEPAEENSRAATLHQTDSLREFLSGGPLA